MTVVVELLVTDVLVPVVDVMVVDVSVVDKVVVLVLEVVVVVVVLEVADVLVAVVNVQNLHERSHWPHLEHVGQNSVLQMPLPSNCLQNSSGRKLRLKHKL